MLKKREENLIETVTRHNIKNSIEILWDQEVSRIDKSLFKHCKSQFYTKQLSLD